MTAFLFIVVHLEAEHAESHGLAAFEIVGSEGECRLSYTLQSSFLIVAFSHTLLARSTTVVQPLSLPNRFLDE